MRYAAVKCMSRSYRPTLPVSYIAQVLGFAPTTEAIDEKDAYGLEECVEWLKAHGASLTADNSGEMMLDTKVCSISILACVFLFLFSNLSYVVSFWKI